MKLLVCNRLDDVEGSVTCMDEVRRLTAELARARAAAQVYVERVDALGLAADDNDPNVMATAEPIGAAQADLYAALGLFERSASGEIAVKPAVETVEQLRAERDSARMLAEVRGRERDRLRDVVSRACSMLDDAVQLRDDAEQWFPAIDAFRAEAGLPTGYRDEDEGTPQ